ncbi:MAG: alkanesulfonate transporter substrate-binding subunit [Hyphomicrobiales bacterium]|nr:alkanesulfonate transporter substrate-binding subunit [Hyphomicrobiales bacterium]
MLKVQSRAMGALLVAFGLALTNARAAELQFGTTGKSDSTSIVSYIAMEKKLFEANGIQLNWFAAGSAAKAVQQTLAGSLDISIAATDQTVRAIAQGAPISIIAGAVTAAPFRVLGNKDVHGWADLKGKTVSVGGPSDQTLFFFRIMARKNGLKDADYDLVYAGTTPARFAQLVSGAVGAAVLTNPNDLVALDGGYTDLGTAPDYVPVWAQNNVFVNSDWAKTHNDLVVGFLRAFISASKFFYDPANREEVLAIFMKYNNSDRNTAERIYQFYQDKGIIARDAALSEAGLQAVVDSLIANKELTSPLSIATIIDAKFLTQAMR